MTLALLLRPSTTPLESSFLGAEIVEDQLAVLAQRPSDLFHRLDAGTHGLPARLIEELRGPGG